MSRKPPTFLAITLGLLSLFATNSEAQTTANREPTFQQRLVAGLQARRPSELRFVQAVVDTVERGDMPQRLVDRFFFWARKRPQRGVNTHRPIVYFQPALTIQARQLGIEIAANPSS